MRIFILETDKMSRIRHQRHEAVKQVAQTTKVGLASAITFLLAIILVLVFRIFDFLWPAGIVEYRNQIAGVLAFILAILIVLSPVIIEVNSRPRPLSGPGKNPYT
jgi:hypothetical protein